MAKIVVIGTSNSVIGRNGFIKSLSLDHEVINLSSGRVPFYCHIQKIQKNKTLIESSDLLIIDHYVNDVGFYADRLKEKYHQECEIFYQLLSTVNTHILNLFFPIQKIANKNLDYYQKVKQLTKQYNLSFIDLNDYEFKSHYFQNPAHINKKASYILGLSLSKVINVFENDKPYGGKLFSSPFKIIDTDNLANFTPHSKLKTFKNSLVKVDYLDIKEEFTIDNLQGMTLKSIGYLAPKNMESKSGLTINNKYSFGLSSGGYFHESFEQEIVIEDKLTLTPIKSSHLDLPAMMKDRGRVFGEFDFLFITELLLFAKSEIQFQAATRNPKPIFLKDLEATLENILTSNKMTKKLPSSVIDKLRDTAIFLENINLEKSYELMKLVSNERPYSPFLKRKLMEYRRKLDKTASVDKNPQELAEVPMSVS